MTAKTAYWHIVEYKQSAQQRGWTFQSATGDKALAEQIASEYRACGIIARARKAISSS
jgi:hypothetical protein